MGCSANVYGSQATVRKDGGWVIPPAPKQCYGLPAIVRCGETVPGDEPGGGGDTVPGEGC